MKRCIKMLDIDVRDGKILPEQPLLALLRGRRTPIWFNQEASSSVMLQLGKCAILEVAPNAPPQVDISVCRNTSIDSSQGGERTHSFLPFLRPFTSFLSTLAQLVFGNNQKNDGDKAKSGKKNKPKPEKQGDREQQEQQKPKTKG